MDKIGELMALNPIGNVYPLGLINLPLIFAFMNLIADIFLIDEVT